MVEPLSPRTVAVLVGGGPAPGLNGVIDAVTRAAHARGWRVLGVPRGFSGLMTGDVSAVHALTPERVAGIATRGGSILFTSRANPTKDPANLARVVKALADLGVTDLVTIGGDDTATSATKVAAAANGRIRAAHVPKTVDNDLPLPGGAPTFGFETAKALGGQLAANLREDARTTGRWYLVTAMGRTAGHLALGIGVTAGAELTIIPEEFGPRVRLADIVDLVEATLIKRRADGAPDGLVVFAEGLLDRLDPEELASLASIERDEHGHPRLSEISLGKVVKEQLGARLRERGIALTFVAKELGYELRCADPVAFDVQYTRTLGEGAVRFLAEGEGDALVSLQDGRIVPIPFDDLRDPATGKVRVRLVDPASDTWRGALALMTRLTPADFASDERVAALAAAGGLAPAAFRERFTSLSKR